MLKLSLHLFALLLISATAQSQTNLNLLGDLQYPQQRGDCSDIWGYVDASGNEYAIVGNQTGTSIVDVSDPTSPVEIFYSAGDQTIWRDMKVWGTTAYITNEGGSGLKIIDLSNLPGPITAADVTQFTGSQFPFTTAHNIFMDENGIAYIAGANNGVGGAIILDCAANALNPVELGRYDDYYMHDVFVRNDTLWGGAINDGFFVVVDVSDPANCVTMATHFTPTTFSHNTWLSDDGNTLYTTDEVSNAYIAAYDVSNLANIVELDRIQSSPGQDVIPHNTFVKGNFLVTSYYTDGIVVHDATNPANLIEVGNYDTSPAFSGDGFNGAWGVYPYFPSGNIIASDIENGLFVLGVNYTPGAYLEGNITDALTSAPLNNAQIDIVATSASDISNGSGDYFSGLASGGTYDVTYSKTGYISETISNVILSNGNTTVVNVELVPLITFTLQGTVEDTNGTPIPNVQISINGPQQSQTTTNGVGQFSLNSFLEGTYELFIGAWGYHPVCISNQQFTTNGGPYVYQLEAGYSDNFELDLGWTVSGSPDTGDWERGEPNGTTYQGGQANPDNDTQDCGEMAFITGNDGGQVGNDDVDEGVTTLSSPLFDLSNYSDPYLSFERWFFNEGGFGTPNDSLIIELSNGTQSVVLDVADQNDPNESEWTYREFRLSDLIPTTSLMQLKVRAMDENGGHLVEGGFDNFLVWDSIQSNASIQSAATIEAISIFPVPFKNEINIKLGQTLETVQVEIFELSSGKCVERGVYKQTNSIQINNFFSRGVYLIKVIEDKQLIAQRKIVKI
jgi:choice-of-anchor B domain-containing protein